MNFWNLLSQEVEVADGQYHQVLEGIPFVKGDN